MAILLNAAQHAQRRRLSWKSTRLTYRDLVFLSKLLPMRLDERYARGPVRPVPRAGRDEPPARLPRLTPRFS